ncbi:hypothetical protein HHI36_005514 [Cryptolaemus montrouzieri]|uniref:Uncharacterized protein n=1 Tax=Cryptolaemus montrouzieri TaxID=559131 RepID=A0ABD2NV93_9CUCU
MQVVPEFGILNRFACTFTIDTFGEKGSSTAITSVEYPVQALSLINPHSSQPLTDETSVNFSRTVDIFKCNEIFFQIKNLVFNKLKNIYQEEHFDLDWNYAFE